VPNRRLRPAGAICFIVFAACDGSTPTSPADVALAELRAAALRVVVEGQTLTITTSLWRDFMPVSPPDGQPLTAVITIRSNDGRPVSERITADASWVLFDNESWRAAPEQRPRPQTSPVYELVVRNGPKWGPNVTVDVVVRLIDSTGRAALLRAADQSIHATH
jgi:hypothetical protein